MKQTPMRTQLRPTFHGGMRLAPFIHVRRRRWQRWIARRCAAWNSYGDALAGHQMAHHFEAPNPYFLCADCEGVYLMEALAHPRKKTIFDEQGEARAVLYSDRDQCLHCHLEESAHEEDDADTWCGNCDNMGFVNCYCGGDLCVCNYNGERPCRVCQ